MLFVEFDPTLNKIILFYLSLSGKTSYRTISWSLEAARFGFKLSQALKFDRHLGSCAADMHLKFQSDTIIITSNLPASILYEIWR